MKQPTANLLLLSAGAIWGMGFVAQSSAMDALGPWAFTAAKFLLAAVVVMPFALCENRSRGRPPLSKDRTLGFVLIGVLLFAAAMLQQVGMVTTSVTNAGFLTGLYVVLTPFLALTLFGSRPHPVVWPAAFLAFAGIALIGGGSLELLSRGDALVIASAVFWSLQILFVARFVQSTGSPYLLAFTQFAITGAASWVGAALLETTTLDALTDAGLEILYGGVLSTGLAFTLQIIAQRHTTPAQAAIFLSSEALFAAAFGALVLGERIAPIGIAGCLMLFAAMLTVELVPTRGPSPR